MITTRKGVSASSTPPHLNDYYKHASENKKFPTYTDNSNQNYRVFFYNFYFVIVILAKSCYILPITFITV